MKRTETILKCDNCSTQKTMNGLAITQEAKVHGWIFAGNHHFCSVSCRRFHRKTRLSVSPTLPVVS